MHGPLTTHARSAILVCGVSRWLGSKSYKNEEGLIVTPTLTNQSVKRAFNFNAGPGALSLSVLEKVREELLDYAGTGMSVMEMSHRSKEFEAINDKAEQSLRRHLGLGDDYAIVFLQGGGSLQFSMVPMNLYVQGKPVDVIDTGAWSSKAISELKKSTPYRIAATTEPEKFVRVPKQSEI